MYCDFYENLSGGLKIRFYVVVNLFDEIITFANLSSSGKEEVVME